MCLELAAGRKWRFLQVDSLGSIVFFAVLGAPALLLFLLLVLGVDDLDSEGVFGLVVLGLSSRLLARGRHSCGVLRLGGP